MVAKSIATILLFIHKPTDYQCNTTFRYKFQIQTSVLMSRAMHEAISSWLFQDLSILKKKPVVILEC